MYKNLYIFDFDCTIMQTPLPEKGKKIWSDYYKTPYPHRGWWSHLHSLDADVFDIKPKFDVISDFIKVKKIPDSLYVMLTSRLPKFKDQIIKILNKHLLFFDLYLFKEYKKSKSDRIDEIFLLLKTLKYGMIEK